MKPAPFDYLCAETLDDAASFDIQSRSSDLDDSWEPHVNGSNSSNMAMSNVDFQAS